MGGRWDSRERERPDSWSRREEWGEDDWDRDGRGREDWGRDAEQEDDEFDDRASGWTASRRPYPPTQAYPPRPPYAQGRPSQSYPAPDWRASSRVGVRGQPPEQPKRGRGGLVTGIVLVFLAIASVGGYVERATLLTLLHRVLPSTGSSARVLPAFPDWRVAYVGSDGRVHAVSLDGATDVSGVSLPSLATASTLLAGGTASPDGHYVAYAGSGGPVLVHLTAHTDDADAIRSGDTCRTRRNGRQIARAWPGLAAKARCI